MGENTSIDKCYQPTTRLFTKLLVQSCTTSEGERSVPTTPTIMSDVNQSQRFAILDCDGGSDDAWALLLLLHAEQSGYLRLLAVTITGCGNTTCDNAARNMRCILKACCREDVSKNDSCV